MTVIGSNGAGKSTTLRTISGLMKPRRGAITFKGEQSAGSPGTRSSSAASASRPEGRRIFPRMTVDENLDLGAFLRTDKAGDREPTGEHVLRPVPPARRAHQPEGRHMSGGEQQMLAVGRAMMGNPSCCCSTSRRWVSPPYSWT